MSEKIFLTVTLIGRTDEIEDLSVRLSDASVRTRPAETPVAGDNLTFSIEPLRALMMTVGASGLVAAMSKCIVTYLRERKKRITIHTAAKQIKVSAENYDQDDLLHILEKLQGRVTILVSDDQVTKPEP